MQTRDVLAGALSLNTIPHVVVGLAGRRLMTPLAGPDSSPRTKLVWAGMNLAGGLLAMNAWTWGRSGQRVADERLRGLSTGFALMGCFAAAFELTPQAEEYRQLRAEAAAKRRRGAA